MITVPELAAEALGSFLSTHLSLRFWSTQAHLTEIVPSVEPEKQSLRYLFIERERLFCIRGLCARLV